MCEREKENVLANPTPGLCSHPLARVGAQHSSVVVVSAIVASGRVAETGPLVGRVSCSGLACLHLLCSNPEGRLEQQTREGRLVEDILFITLTLTLITESYTAADRVGSGQGAKTVVSATGATALLCGLCAIGL